MTFLSVLTISHRSNNILPMDDIPVATNGHRYCWSLWTMRWSSSLAGLQRIQQKQKNDRLSLNYWILFNGLLDMIRAGIHWIPFRLHSLSSETSMAGHVTGTVAWNVSRTAVLGCTWPIESTWSVSQLLILNSLFIPLSTLLALFQGPGEIFCHQLPCNICLLWINSSLGFLCHPFATSIPTGCRATEARIFHWVSFDYQENLSPIFSFRFLSSRPKPQICSCL